MQELHSKLYIGDTKYKQEQKSYLGGVLTDDGNMRPELLST